MKLLLDQNLSFRLTDELEELYPGSIHVKTIGMDNATDTDIWNYAKENGFVIASKDSDFHQRGLLLGSPPKVVWIQKGNCSTEKILGLLKNHVDTIRSFVEMKESSFLVLG